MRDLVFVRFAHIDDFDAEARIVQGLFHVVHGHFVGIYPGSHRFGGDAAELIVIDQFVDGGVVATERAVRVAAQFEFLEPHIERVEEQQAADEGTAFAQSQLEDFRGLNAADNAGQHAQDTPFGATGHHPGRRRFRIKTPIAGAAEVRRENARLAFETKNRAVNIWFLEQDAGVIGEITRGKVIRAIDNDVVLAEDLAGVVAGKADLVQDDVDPRIDAFDGLLGGFSFVAPDVLGAVDDLALEVGAIDRVEIDQPETADARSGQVHGDGRTEPASADAQDAAGTDFLLARQADLGQDQMSRVTAYLFVA